MFHMSITAYFDKLNKIFFDVLLSLFQTEACQVIPKTPGAISKNECHFMEVVRRPHTFNTIRSDFILFK